MKTNAICQSWNYQEYIEAKNWCKFKHYQKGYKWKKTQKLDGITIHQLHVTNFSLELQLVTTQTGTEENPTQVINK